MIGKIEVDEMEIDVIGMAAVPGVQTYVLVIPYVDMSLKSSPRGRTEIDGIGTVQEIGMKRTNTAPVDEKGLETVDAHETVT